MLSLIFVNLHFRAAVKACIVLFPLLGITWLFGLLSMARAGVVSQYVFTVLNSIQVRKYIMCTYFRTSEKSFPQSVFRFIPALFEAQAQNMVRTALKRSITLLLYFRIPWLYNFQLGSEQSLRKTCISYN